jgi:hypothetical protein
MRKIFNFLKILEAKINADTILFFDMDGTLINTDYANFLSYSRAIKEILDLDSNIIFDQNIRFTREILKKQYSELSKQKLDKIINLKEKLYIEYLSDTTQNRLIVSLLKIYSKTNKTVLVTNSQQVRADLILAHHNLTNYFSHKIYFQNAINGEKNKYEYAISHLGCSPASIIIFENEPNEIISATKVKIPLENIIYLNKKSWSHLQLLQINI